MRSELHAMGSAPRPNTGYRTEGKRPKPMVVSGESRRHCGGFAVTQGALRGSLIGSGHAASGPSSTLFANDGPPAADSALEDLEPQSSLRFAESAEKSRQSKRELTHRRNPTSLASLPWTLIYSERLPA